MLEEKNLNKEEKNMNKKKEWISLIIGIIGSTLGLFGVVSFNKYLLSSLPIWLRMICMILSYWLIALVPIILMKVNRDKLSDYGFKKDKKILQILIGFLIGIGMSIILTLIPHLLGFGNFVNNNHLYKYAWQFIFDFFYFIFAVAFVEEFVFRGFIYSKIKNISNNEILAIIISSLLFGLFHLFGGNVIQLVMTTIIGSILCIFRYKIKNCSTLSLIIGHGIYDALITVLTCLFL